MNATHRDTRVDPVTLEIVRNALVSTAQRITRRMIRSAKSFIVKEMEDCSASVLDVNGQLLAEEAGPPIQLSTVGICLQTVLSKVLPADMWKPGDVVLVNDPFLAGESLAATHTNDYLAFYPLFFDAELIGFSGLMVHHLDIGGMNMATRGWNREIYHEGLRLPPVKIVREGVIQQDIMDIILTNTRTRDVHENDVLSQIASVKAAEQDIESLFRKYGKDLMYACFEALIAHSEHRTREEIRSIPDGSYTHEELILDDGAQGGPFKLQLKVVKAGSDITFDFTGTDKQVTGPINSPLATTLSAIYYTMRCVTGSAIPSNEGCKRPIKVIAPPGTLVNARSPAAVYQRMVVCHTVVDLVMGALAKAVPERVMGDSCGCSYNWVHSIDPRSDSAKTFGEVAPGGLGATHAADGINVMACHVTNCHIPPMESMEIESPVLYLQREFRSDTGGAGEYRGGVGQVLKYKILGKSPMLAHTSQKSKSLPQGVAGGKPGDGGGWIINEGLAAEHRLQYATGELEPLVEHDTVTHMTPGGGGYGDPHRRNPAAVAADVRAGLVSPEKAWSVYGVRLDSNGTISARPILYPST